MLSRQKQQSRYIRVPASKNPHGAVKLLLSIFTDVQPVGMKAVNPLVGAARRAGRASFTSGSDASARRPYRAIKNVCARRVGA